MSSHPGPLCAPANLMAEEDLSWAGAAMHSREHLSEMLSHDAAKASATPVSASTFYVSSLDDGQHSFSNKHSEPKKPSQGDKTNNPFLAIAGELGIGLRSPTAFRSKMVEERRQLEASNQMRRRNSIDMEVSDMRREKASTQMRRRNSIDMSLSSTTSTALASDMKPRCASMPYLQAACDAACPSRGNVDVAELTQAVGGGEVSSTQEQQGGRGALNVIFERIDVVEIVKVAERADAGQQHLQLMLDVCDVVLARGPDLRCEKSGG